MKKTIWILTSTGSRRGVVLLATTFLSVVFVSTGHAQVTTTARIEHLNPDGTGVRATKSVRNFWCMFGEMEVVEDFSKR